MVYFTSVNPCPFPVAGFGTVWTMSLCERVRRRFSFHSRLSSLWSKQNTISQSISHLRSIAAFCSVSSLTRSLTSLWRGSNQIIKIEPRIYAQNVEFSLKYRIYYSNRRFYSGNTGKLQTKISCKSHELAFDCFHTQSNEMEERCVSSEQWNHSLNIFLCFICRWNVTMSFCQGKTEYKKLLPKSE